MIVFAVETSCDETSICIINSNGIILSHIVYSQLEHEKFGGVIPELASRAHLQILQKITKDALGEAKISIDNIDLFCATCGPGLIGGLLVGSTFTKGLALGCDKPFMPINHLEGHLLSTTFNNITVFPYVSFLLTGGHTQIYLVNSINNYELLGETLDDAIGEAFDKVAKLLGLSYPGGPEIEKRAINGNINKFKLPHPLKKNNDLTFSFSGIKTAVNLLVKKEDKLDDIFINNMAASFQNKICEILISKLNLTISFLKKRKINISQISLVGGVAANQFIYKHLTYAASKYLYSITVPPKYMLSDNAAMIGWACLKKYNKNYQSNIFFKPNPRLTINKEL
jgi:N6-L-threonylcarbamoyladenine synthase